MGKLRNEDPKRLRECLNALSEACGHDVYRFEVVSSAKGLRFIITCSKETSEETIAVLIAAKLRENLAKNVQLNTDEIDGGSDAG